MLVDTNYILDDIVDTLYGRYIIQMKDDIVDYVIDNWRVYWWNVKYI